MGSSLANSLVSHSMEIHSTILELCEGGQTDAAILVGPQHGYEGAEN